MGEGYYLQKVVLTVAEGSEWTCLEWSCLNEVVRFSVVFPETDIYHPGSCGKPDESDLPNRFPMEDSFSERSVGKYGWEGREVEEDWTGPDWQSRERERERESEQHWLPVRGTQQPSLQYHVALNSCS